MPESDDLEPRVTALETEVRELKDQVRHTRQDAAAARVLAGGADRDVAELRTEFRTRIDDLRTDLRSEINDFRRATNASFNAMREDLTDVRQKMDDGFRRMDEEFRRVDQGFTQVRGVLDAVAAGQEQTAVLLGRLIEQGDGPTGTR